MKLREILVVEGLTRNMGELLSSVVEAVSAIGYLEGMRLVIEEYKPAAAKRQPLDGVNVSEESVRAFRAFSGAMTALAEGCHIPVVQALYLHDAASGLSRGNGNLPDQQVELNRHALLVLGGVSSVLRGDDWWCVYEKVMVGLMEAGHVAFNEDVFRSIIESMKKNHAKDAAGRQAHLAERLAEQDRLDEAIEVLASVEGDTYSAPNQRGYALGLLERYRAVAVTRRGTGTSRERRAPSRRKKGSGATKEGDPEPPPIIRHRAWYGTIGGTFISTRRDNVVVPTHDLLQKSIKLLVLFCLFFLFKNGILFLL